MARNAKIKRIAILVLAVLACLAVVLLLHRFYPTSKRMDPGTYFGLTEGEVPTFAGENETVAAVIADDTIEEEKALIVNGQVYIDYNLVERELNSRFYWDSSEGLMLFTTPEELYEIGVDTSAYTIDQEGYDAGYEIVRSASTGLFFSAQFLEEHSDLTWELYEEPARVVVTMGSEAVTTAEVKRNCKLRESESVKSFILTDLTKEQQVRILSQEEDGDWSLVMTEDGYIGSVKTKYLKNQTDTVTETTYAPDYTSLALSERVNLVWHEINYPEMNANLAEDVSGISGVNVISPTWYYLNDNEGGVLSYADASYVEEAHELGLQVWPLISNFSSEVSTSTILSTRWVRRSLEHYLVDQALELKFDGINIDFEGITEEAGYDYVQFLRELSILCRVNGIYLSVDIPAPYSFNTYYNRKELGTVCDYVIMMGYDEHYVGSEAGSVASLSFEENGIINSLTAVPREKFISGIPFYSRIWYTTTYTGGDVEVTSEVVTMKGTEEILDELGVEVTYDEESGQNYAEWMNEDGAYCQFWIEDDDSVRKRAALVAAYDLGGIAEWRLGNESTEVWEIISEEIK